MAKYGSDDETDSCVFLGTPLIDLIPEDAKFTNKPKRQEEQIVTDEKGRQRFHGAFTGGFSAGYFNTVGTKEGWAPSTFKSSRHERASKAGQQRPEDFMDEEDFGEFGIAPRTLSIKNDYKDKSLESVETSAQKRSNIVLFDDLIKPVRGTIGVRMLKKMGWREGQGVGPKVKRTLRKLKAKKADEPGRKIYGVALPADDNLSDIEDEVEDDYLVSLYDINQYKFDIKEDTFGLGYKRLDVNELFAGSNKIGALTVDKTSSVADILFPEMRKKTSKKLAISGHAFGVGDFEDDEDTDFYKQDALDNYDFDLDAKCEKEKRDMLDKSYGFSASVENDLFILRKFSMSSKKQEPAKVFKAPEVPKNFNLIHKLDTKEATATVSKKSTNENDAMNVYLKSATERGELLGETFIQPDSVFDLLNSKDRDFLRQEKLKQNLKSIADEIKSSSSSIVINESVTATGQQEKIPSRKEVDQEKQKLNKQKRYEQFLNYIKRNYKDPYSFVDTHDLTEWEREHEKEEFLRTYQNQSKKIDEKYRAVSNKFVSANVLIKGDDNQIIESEIAGNKLTSIETSIEKAAKEKKFGKLTRVVYDWRPHNVICKRFNVPNPYPDEKECGTVGNTNNKRQNRDDKFSIFDVLTRENKFETKSSDIIDSNGNVVKKPSNIVNKSDSNVKEMKIEFETKQTGVDSSDKKLKYNEKTALIEDENNKENVEIKKSENLNKNNVYLQDRPDIDIFKEIFGDLNEANDTIEDKKDDSSDDEINTEPEKEIFNDVRDSNKVDLNKKTSGAIIEAIPSSISAIDFEKLNKYLVNDDDDDINEHVKSKTHANSDFFDANEYEKLNKAENEKKQNIYGPAVPIIFKSTNQKSIASSSNLSSVLRKLDQQNSANKVQEYVQIDSSSSSSSSDDEFEFVEKSNKREKSESSSSDNEKVKNKKKHKTHKRNKKKEHKKKKKKHSKKE